MLTRTRAVLYEQFILFSHLAHAHHAKNVSLHLHCGTPIIATGHGSSDENPSRDFHRCYTISNTRHSSASALVARARALAGDLAGASETDFPKFEILDESRAIKRTVSSGHLDTAIC